jgi:hypothetical protein
MSNDPAQMMAAVTTSMAERTGRTLEEWVELVHAEGPDPLDQKAVRAWLRDVHGMKQNSQWAVADAAAQRAGWRRPSVDDYVDGLYAGKAAALRPLHDAVVTAALALGSDVTVEGRATYLPLVRRRQFAAVAPGPRGTLRVGLRFRDDVPDHPELAPAKGFAQATHWVHVPGDAKPDDVAADLSPLLEEAYRQNG